mgnify:CR=1 FL=1
MNQRKRRFSAGIVLVRKIDSEWHYLLLRCFRLWDFPKGQVEAGESPLQAAIREVREETTLTHLCFNWGECFQETLPYAQGKVARYYLAESPSGEVNLPINPELNKPEHHEFCWCGVEEMKHRVPPRLNAIVKWASGIVGE